MYRREAHVEYTVTAYGIEFNSLVEETPRDLNSYVAFDLLKYNVRTFATSWTEQSSWKVLTPLSSANP